MSGRLVSDALLLPIPSGVKFVLVVLCSHADDETKTCWPGIDLLVKETSKSKPQIKRHLKTLRDAGFIERISTGKGGRGNADEYFLTIPKGIISDTKGITHDTLAEHQRVSFQTQRVSFESTKGIISDFAYKEGTVTEPLKNRKDLPRWVEILSQDERWKEVTDDFIQDLEQSYPNVNLTMEAQKCLAWLGEGKGKRRKTINRTWATWVDRASKPLPVSSNGANRVEAPTDRSIYSRGHF